MKTLLYVLIIGILLLIFLIAAPVFAQPVEWDRLTKLYHADPADPGTEGLAYVFVMEGGGRTDSTIVYTGPGGAVWGWETTIEPPRFRLSNAPVRIAAPVAFYHLQYGTDEKPLAEYDGMRQARRVFFKDE